MTVTSTTSRNDYNGAGSTGPYVYGFRIFAATDLLVTKADANGLETTLVYLSDFSVTGVGAMTGGTITLFTALAVGERLTIRRVLPLTQLINLRNQGATFPANLENGLDQALMRAQQLENDILGSVHLPETISPTAFDTTLPANLAAGQALVVNAAGTGLSMGALTAAQLSAWSATHNLVVDAFTAGFTPGVTTQLTLSANPGNVNNVAVTMRISGTVRVFERDEYSVAGTTLTFTSAIPAGTTRIEVTYQYTYQVNTAAAANVTWSQAGAGAVGRTVSNKLRDVVHVADFGAVGDDATDDTAAIAAALAVMPTNGGTLVFGPHTYKITDTLTVKGGVVVVGASSGKTTIKQYANKTAFSATAATGSRNIAFLDLFVEDAFGAGRTVGYGILVDGTGDAAVCALERVLTNGFIDGVRIVAPLTCRLSQVRSNSNLQDGIALYGQGTSTTLESCYANANVRHGFYVDGGLQYCAWIACASDSNGGDAYHFDNNVNNSFFLSLISCGAEITGGHAFYFHDGYGHSILNPKVTTTTGVTKDGIRFDGTTRSLVIGGEFFACSGYGVNAITSGTPVTPYAINVDGTSIVGCALGNVNDPNAAVTWSIGKSFSVGTASTTATQIGRMTTNLTAVGNTGAGETDMQTVSIPANTLFSSGQCLRVTVWGETAANANNKTIRLKFGALTIATIGPAALNGPKWRIEALIPFITAATQKITGIAGTDDTVLGPTVTYGIDGAVNLAITNTLKTTGQGTANNDIIQRGTLVEVLT